jgi:serine/threonine-protein kinase
MAEPETPAEPARDPLIGRVLSGRYQIRRMISAGGMGRVYEGRQRALDRAVAIKCIHPYLLSSELMVVRFMEEARVASGLVHPNIVKIYDFGRTEPSEGSTLFIVMELLSGIDLSTLIAERAPLPLARTYSILRQVLSALGEAHARGVTHRDAKPDNVILEPTVGGGERVKVIDFGIAKVHGAKGVTGVGHFVGTPHYMAPEQIRGEKVEVSADLYAVGVTLFQMLTGRLPFDGDSMTKVLEQQLFAPRPDPREVAPDAGYSPLLSEVCRRALHVSPDERYRTADAFAEALEKAVSDVVPPWSRRNPYSAPPPPETLRSSDSGERPSVVVPANRSLFTSGDAESVADAIESTADAAVLAGHPESAVAELRRGIALARNWQASGEAVAGNELLISFGRRLGIVLRNMGRLEESEREIERALQCVHGDDMIRARLLAELAETRAERGKATEAEACRLEALRIASAAGDRELIARLRRLAQSLALDVASRRAITPNPERRSSEPPPRVSEWRVKPEKTSAGQPPARRKV